MMLISFYLAGEKKLVRVGNYMMTGKVLGKGHFARVEEAVHGVLNVKVSGNSYLILKGLQTL